MSSSPLSSPSTTLPLPLPPLTTTPTPHPHSCASLSAPLVAHLAALLPARPALTLSIGCGAGLLEALVTASAPVDVLGVEVAGADVRYLPAVQVHRVEGTWALDPAAGRASAWVFVYPREAALLQRYWEGFGEGLGTVVWIGPRADWWVFGEVMEGWRGGSVPFWDGEEVGLAGYERLAVWRRDEEGGG